MLENPPDIPFYRLIWVLPCAWTLHEAEEWNIIDWYEKYWVNVPSIRPIAVWTALGMVSLVGFVWTLLGTLSRSNYVAAFVVMPFFTIVAFGNAVQHIYFVFEFSAYAPGVMTAVALIMPTTLWLTIVALQRRLIPWWYAVLIYVPIIPQTLFTMAAGNEMPAMIRVLTQFSDRVAGVFFGSG